MKELKEEIRVRKIEINTNQAVFERSLYGSETKPKEVFPGL